MGMHTYDLSGARSRDQCGSVLHHDGKSIGQCRERALLEGVCSDDAGTERIWQVTRGRGRRHHRGLKSLI
jgi:hypothetical protein